MTVQELLGAPGGINENTEVYFIIHNQDEDSEESVTMAECTSVIYSVAQWYPDDPDMMRINIHLAP